MHIFSANLVLVNFEALYQNTIYQLLLLGDFDIFRRKERKSSILPTVPIFFIDVL